MHKENGKKACIGLALALGLTATGCGMLSGAEDEEDWPTRNLELVVPFSAGGDTDFNARAYADGVQDELGVNVTVINTEGEGGAVASREVHSSTPDGYTAMVYHGAAIMNEATGATQYGVEDFEYVATIAENPGELIVVREDTGFEDLDDLIEYSQDNPGDLRVAANVGATTHLLALQLEQAGADINIVATGGGAERVASLQGGHVDVIFNAYGDVADYIESGDFVALGNVSGERAEAYDEVPTATEQGHEIEMENYYFLVMPPETPEHAVEGLADAFESVSVQTDYQESILSAYLQQPVFERGEQGLEMLDGMKEQVDEFSDEF